MPHVLHRYIHYRTKPRPLTACSWPTIFAAGVCWTVAMRWVELTTATAGRTMRPAVIAASRPAKPVRRLRRSMVVTLGNYWDGDTISERRKRSAIRIP